MPWADTNTPFVGGSVIGLRFSQIRAYNPEPWVGVFGPGFAPNYRGPEGFLWGGMEAVHPDGVPYESGVNEARHVPVTGCLCPLCSPPAGIAERLRIIVEGPDHLVADRNCRCGFHALFDPNPTEWAGSWNVPVILEGFGRVTLGTKGFRASKCRVLAMSRDQAWHDALPDNYPDAAVFDTKELMLAEFPLTDPTPLLRKDNDAA